MQVSITIKSETAACLLGIVVWLKTGMRHKRQHPAIEEPTEKTPGEPAWKKNWSSTENGLGTGPITGSHRAAAIPSVRKHWGKHGLDLCDNLHVHHHDSWRRGVHHDWGQWSQGCWFHRGDCQWQEVPRWAMNLQYWQCTYIELYVACSHQTARRYYDAFRVHYANWWWSFSRRVWGYLRLSS